LEKIQGTWQFMDRAVWIEVRSDGSTLQCRKAPSGAIFKSIGQFISPNEIRWQEIWGIDQVSTTDGVLTLSGEWGVFSHGKAIMPMSEQCLSDRP
jgi:hypothetical protein